jgi:hypothetical protein
MSLPEAIAYHRNGRCAIRLIIHAWKAARLKVYAQKSEEVWRNQPDRRTASGIATTDHGYFVAIAFDLNALAESP